ncbi:MAG: polymorphic toxin type 44 domain-containing protein [Candidatus Magasanikbacteria bacterium]
MEDYSSFADAFIGSWFVPHSITRKALKEKLSYLSWDDINLISNGVLAELEKRPNTFIEFYNKVHSGGEWDLKYYYPSMESGLVSQEEYDSKGDKAKSYYDTPPYGYKNLGSVKIGKAIVRNDAPGNILFGYAGTAVGFSKDSLKMLAGLANKNQYLENGGKEEDYKYTWSGSYYDDPYDQAAIQIGIDVWNNN